MDLRRFQYLAAAARTGNLSAAARELGLSQPALSKSLRALEQELGVTLLERGRFGVRPTPYGEAVLAHGRSIGAELRSLEEHVQALRRTGTSILRIGCGPSEATTLLPLALTRVLAERPNLRFSIRHGLNDALMPWVRQGEVEFALSWAPNFVPDDDLVHDALYNESACVVARRGHPLSQHRSVSAGELAACRWILSRSQSLDRRSFENLFLSKGLTPPPVAVETTSTILVKALVASSDFLTFIPRELMYWEQRHAYLMELRTEGPGWSGSVGITRRRRGTLSPAAQALIDAIKHTARESFPRLHRRKTN